MDAAKVPIDTLLAHREWVRAVARAVVRDPNAADDIEQETWLAALKTPPRDASSLRGWFGAVTRSRARRIGRTDSRREARESVVARGERTASAAELAEIADTHRRVVAAVLELDEVHRAAILLRYFEGLPVEDVAARMGAPLETTRSRIKRGVGKLRERLEREFGTKGRPWHLALVPLIGGTRETGAGVGVGAAVGGGVVMASTTKTAVAAVAVLLLLGAGAVVLVPKWTEDKEQVVADVPAVKPEPAEKRAPQPVRAATPRARPEPEPAPAPEETKPAPSVKPAVPAETVPERLAKAKLTFDWKETKLIHVFAELAARSSVDIVISQEAVDAWANQDQFDGLILDQECQASRVLDMVTSLRGLEWTVEEPRVVIVPMGVKRDPAKPVIVPPAWVPPPAITVIGRVTDAAGAALPGATIVRVLDCGERFVATADIAGRFEVKLAKPYGSLEAHADGRQPSLAVPVTGEPGAQVTLELATGGEGGTIVVKLVSDVRPLPPISVRLGRDSDVRKKLEDGRTAVLRARVASSEEHTEVTFAGVAPGRTSVSVRDEKFEAQPVPVEAAAGKTAEVTLRLVPRLTLAETLATKRTTINFQQANAGEIVKYLNTVFSLSIVMDPSLAPEMNKRAISLVVTDKPLDEALRELCREIGGATYVIQGPIVFITAEKR